ncbi:MAG TPA: hypothetical protein VHU14_02355 [Solirubrobacterales bacterium]|jgi:hypothetical protein|nr:hypothetical protein [Solirubrobacterales bacterium]
MQVRRIAAPLIPLLVLGLVLSGCGGGSSQPTSRSTAASRTEGQAAEESPETEAPSEAESEATGDIPDNQVFLTFTDRPAGYSIRYPEGWARRGAAGDVTFQEKGNVIHVVVAKGVTPTPASATAALARLKRNDPTIKVGRPERLTIAGAPAIKVTYTRLSSPDPVTGKQLPLTIDRYLYAHGGKVATLDLGTPVGVDNVDAYRLISRSFRWG